MRLSRIDGRRRRKRKKTKLLSINYSYRKSLKYKGISRSTREMNKNYFLFFIIMKKLKRNHRNRIHDSLSGYDRLNMSVATRSQNPKKYFRRFGNNS